MIMLRIPIIVFLFPLILFADSVETIRSYEVIVVAEKYPMVIVQPTDLMVPNACAVENARWLKAFGSQPKRISFKMRCIEFGNRK